jgi:diguanylate cyclase (GGDEF)-like protein
VLRPEQVGGRLGRLLSDLGLEYSIIVPLMDGDRFLGIATANWRRVPQDAAEHTELLERLRGAGHQAASALRSARLTEQIRRQAELDDLTGLPNRRVFLRGLELALGRAELAAAQPVGVLYCDLDGFKAVNDGHGHAAGDELLRQVAARLGLAVTDAGQLARLAGDEFAVLLPSTDRSSAEQVASRVVSALQTGFDVGGVVVDVTVSVGVAVDDGVGDGDRLLRRADAAMYAAKEGGRNRVCWASEGSATVAPVPQARRAGDQADLRSAVETARPE